jgi:peroxiredoxin
MQKPTVILVTWAFAVFLVCGGCETPVPVASRSVGVSVEVVSVTVGELAPNFTLVDATGGYSISLVDYRSKVVLLDFFATWCGPCRRAIDEDLVPLHGRYADSSRVVLLSIDIAEPEITAQELQTFASEHLMEWPILMGSHSSVDKDYGVTAVPTIFVIDSAGVIRQRHVGSPGATTLSNEVDALISWHLFDLNGDGVINVLDISIVARAFGSKSGDANWNQIADFNQDGIINILDISLVARQFGKTV